MKPLYLSWVLLLLLLISFESLSREQNVYQVNLEHEVTRTESIVPTYYQEYGDYLFFLSQPSYDPQCCSQLPAHYRSGLWRLDTRTNTVVEVIANIGYGERETFTIVNDRILYFASNGFYSADLDGLNKKFIKQLRNGGLDYLSMQMISFNDYAYFSVLEDNGKSGLWRSNGTVQGTTKVDLCLGEVCSYFPQELTVSANKLFVYTGISEDETTLWAINSEGVPTAITQTTLSSFETSLSPVQGGVYFNSPTQLWFSDGTINGTYPTNFVKDNSPTIAFESVLLGDSAIVANQGVYVLDKKGKGTTVQLNTNPESQSGDAISATDLTYFNGRVFLLSKFYDSTRGGYYTRLLSVDGTPDGLQLIYKFPVANDVQYKIIGTNGNKLVLLRDEVSFSLDGSKNEVWISDGTPNGTHKISDNAPPRKLWKMKPWQFINDELYFSGFSIEHGIELWRSDSSILGTSLAKDIGYGGTTVQKGPITSDLEHIYYTMLRSWYGELEGIVGSHTEPQLWKTNVSTMESEKVDEWSFDNTRPVKIATVDGGQFWWNLNEDNYTFNLVYFDYQSKEVTTVLSGLSDHCATYNFKELEMLTHGKKYLFEAPVEVDGVLSCQLWVSDGTLEGTITLTYLPDTNYFPRKIKNLVLHQNEVYFSLVVEDADHAALSNVVFKTDGTVEGTVEAFRIDKSDVDEPTLILDIISNNLSLFIKSYDGVSYLSYRHSSEPAKTLITSDRYNALSLVNFKQGVGFVFEGGVWFSDGTDAGTYEVVASQELGENKSIEELYSAPNNDLLLFSVRIENHHIEMWASDGTAAGTRLLVPQIDSGIAKISAFEGNDAYLTEYIEIESGKYLENIKRYSLIDNSTDLIMQRAVSSPSSTIGPTILTVQNRVFIGDEDTNTFDRTLGGPFVTANLIGNDADNDGILNAEDMFPFHQFEYIDSDLDGFGNNYDTDDDNDGIRDEEDIYPLNSSEWADYDNDGVGDREDNDDDNDGVSDWNDSYPRDASKSQNDMPKSIKNEDSSSSGSSGSMQVYLTLLIIFLLSLRINRHGYNRPS